MPPAEALSRAIHALADRHDLSADLAEEAFIQVMQGEASPVETAALLIGLRTKGETVAEVIGAARALRGAMVRVLADGPLVDTCGTGGGTTQTFNISTAAAFVAAGAGARVAKHGNRSFTSRSGSADVLEALGVAMPQTAESAAAQLSRAGMTFLFAPLFHPAMRHAGPVRRELGVATIMNVLGPLANPAGVRRQVIGVADPGHGSLMAGALAGLGCEHALVVHAREGMDEISPCGPTDVWEVRSGEVTRTSLDPARLELPRGERAGLSGGDPARNAEMIVAVLSGRDRTVRRAAVVVNTAAALLVAGAARDWDEGVTLAGRAIDEGRALQVLAAMRAGAP